MSDKKKWAREEAGMVGLLLLGALQDFCEPERVMICGSIRRKKPMVGDAELVFVPKLIPVPTGDFFAPPKMIPATDAVLEKLLADGVLAKRRNVNGSEMWGEKNKLAVHVPTGIPVDLFTASAGNWWNYVVCRTGGAENNMAIASAAIRKGWKWNPYSEGFSRAKGLGREVHAVTSERDVFDFVGLPYREPEHRQ